MLINCIMWLEVGGTLSLHSADMLTTDRQVKVQSSVGWARYWHFSWGWSSINHFGGLWTIRKRAQHSPPLLVPPLPVLPSDPGKRGPCPGPLLSSVLAVPSTKSLWGLASMPPQACATSTSMSFGGMSPWDPRIPCKDDPKSTSRLSKSPWGQTAQKCAYF